MGILRGEGIEVLIDGNKADIPQTEILLNVVPCVDGIPAQPGEIFYNDAVLPIADSICLVTRTLRLYLQKSNAANRRMAD